MKHLYTVSFEYTRTHPKRAIRDIVAQFPGAEVQLDDDLGITLTSQNEAVSRALFEEGRRRGFKCSLEVTTEYDYEDALRGDLGILHLGPASSTIFRAVLPKNAFDFSTGCPRCGLGAAQVWPRVISERSIRCSANFYPSDMGAGQGAYRVMVRAEVGHAVIEATGQPWCMRHPVTRKGRVVEEWMEPVPCATMPSLSPKSEGVLWGSTTALSSIGEPAQVVEPCRVCGRSAWAEAYDVPTRLVYSRPAIEAAQKHAVVAMYEPHDIFPAFDPLKRTFKHLYGLPWLLFNRKAIEVLLKYTQMEHIRDSASIQPVFSE